MSMSTLPALAQRKNANVVVSMDECMFELGTKQSHKKEGPNNIEETNENSKGTYSLYTFQYSRGTRHCDRLDASTTQRRGIRCMSGRKKGMIVSGLSEDCSRIALAGFGTNVLELVGT